MGLTSSMKGSKGLNILSQKKTNIVYKRIKDKTTRLSMDSDLTWQLAVKKNLIYIIICLYVYDLKLNIRIYEWIYGMNLEKLSCSSCVYDKTSCAFLASRILKKKILLTFILQEEIR